MAELKDNQLVFIDEEQNEILCDIIFTYNSEEFAKNYVFFTPVGSEDEDGRCEVAVASYVPTEDGIGELSPVETEEEWDMLEEVFQAYAEDSECGCGCGEDCECDGECECEENEEECHCCCGHHHHK